MSDHTESTKVQLPITRDGYEYISIVMSRELLRFCRDNDLPFESADDLILRDEITDFEYGWLSAFNRMWEGLME